MRRPVTVIERMVALEAAAPVVVVALLLYGCDALYSMRIQLMFGLDWPARRPAGHSSPAGERESPRAGDARVAHGRAIERYHCVLNQRLFTAYRFGSAGLSAAAAVRYAAA